jgi:hypothetical protein
VVLNRNNDILVSFADDTPPSYAAIFALLLDQIDNTNLLIWYATKGQPTTADWPWLMVIAVTRPLVPLP